MTVELLFVALGVAFMIGFALQNNDSLFQDHDHGLAYIVEKKMFMLTTLSVTGKSSEIDSSVVFNSNKDQFKVHISLPVESLDSGLEDRDKSVQDFLKFKEHPNITFTSDWLAYDSLNFETEMDKTVPGLLCFGGDQFHVHFPLRFTRHESYTQISGILAYTFTKFDMACPRVAGGLVADVKDRLDIVVNLRSDKIEGLEELLSPRKVSTEIS